MIKRKFWLFCLWVLLFTSPALGDISDLLKWQRQGDSGAYVSSGFHDWRGISKYRSRSGLHAGYDIAMLPGSSVRSPWSGTVVAVTPWYGEEVGVTVRLSNGFEATFGHIRAAKYVGDTVSRGDTVGYVVVDHVDVKMRDQNGAYKDFGSHKIVDLSPLPSETPKPLPPDPALVKAASEAYQEYERQIDRLDREEEQVRIGLLAPNKAESTRRRLDKLRGLAQIHVKLTGSKLSQRQSPRSSEAESLRPLTDQILESLD